MLIASVFAKGRLSRCERRPFSLSLTAFCTVKCRQWGSSANLLDDNKAQQGVEDVQLCLTACGAKRNLRYVCANNIVLEEGEQQAAIRPLRGRELM